jgi:hypothetical protein
MFLGEIEHAQQYRRQQIQIQNLGLHQPNLNTHPRHEGQTGQAHMTTLLQKQWTKTEFLRIKGTNTVTPYIPN